jgi:hypothetical protein
MISIDKFNADDDMFVYLYRQVMEQISKELHASKTIPKIAVIVSWPPSVFITISYNLLAY